MKRSEAIIHISNVLRITGNHYCDDGRDLQDADTILKRLESIGMLPPTVRLPIFRVMDNAWEPESEQR